MKFTEIRHGSPEYQLECLLRNQVLRAPLGMKLTAADLSDEIHHRHFGTFLPDGSLVACAIAVPTAPREIKIRQMAVRPDQQRKGHGRTLILNLMHHLTPTHPHRFTLHARTHVRRFYESLGFTPSGPIFDEIGIPHIKMTLTFPAPAPQPPK